MSGRMKRELDVDEKKEERKGCAKSDLMLEEIGLLSGWLAEPPPLPLAACRLSWTIFVLRVLVREGADLS